MSTSLKWSRLSPCSPFTLPNRSESSGSTTSTISATIAPPMTTCSSLSRERNDGRARPGRSAVLTTSVVIVYRFRPRGRGLPRRGAVCPNTNAAGNHPAAASRSRDALASGSCVLVPAPTRGGRSAERRPGAAAPGRPAHDAAGRALAKRPAFHDAERAPFGAPPWRFVAGVPRFRLRHFLRNPCSDAPRSQVVLPGGRGPGPPGARLRAAAAERHTLLRLWTVSGRRPSMSKADLDFMSDAFCSQYIDALCPKTLAMREQDQVRRRARMLVDIGVGGAGDEVEVPGLERGVVSGPRP